MQLSTLTALSPLDGRYHAKLDALRPWLSEYGLIYHRVFVEIRWLIALSENPAIAEVPKLSTDALQILKNIHEKFNQEDAEKIKTLEKTTNHDVKAIEYFLREKFHGHPQLTALISFIHFGATSEDINNLSYGLMVKQARDTVIIPTLEKIITTLRNMAEQYAEIPMLARTHGQPATPTTLGKEMANFVARLEKQANIFSHVLITGKFNGAVGNYNAYQFSYPEVNWPAFCKQFVTDLGLTWNAYTTQIEPHDHLAELLHAMARINTILIDLNRDLWGYISLGYFQQKILKDEIGSSTMPHKVNPIDFENSEGNLGIANALAYFMAEKLPISRWQRDLSDSTVLRNLGAVFGHALLAYHSLLTGLNKLAANEKIVREDLNAHWEVLTEAVQTLLRRFGIADAYEQLKHFSRGKKLDVQMMGEFINTLTIPPEVKNKLKDLQPEDYIGYARELAKQNKKSAIEK